MKPFAAEVQRQAQDSTLAVAIFDALGLPAENLTRQEILERMPTVADEYLRCPPSHPAHSEHFPGKWSDDAQLTLAVQQGVIDAGGQVDMPAIAKRHVQALKESIMGWGRATRESVRRLGEGADHRQSGQEGGSGNGVAMKMIPLALAMHHSPDPLNPQERLDLIAEFTCMTHRSAIALVCSAVHAQMLEDVLSSDPSQIKTLEGRHAFISRALDLSRRFEADFGEAQKELSRRLQGMADRFAELSSDEALLELSNGSCFVPDSLAMCYGLLAADFSFAAARRAVLIGGDTDSNASIVGGAVALVEPIGNLPLALREGVWRRTELLETSSSFTRALLGRMEP